MTRPSERISCQVPEIESCQPFMKTTSGESARDTYTNQEKAFLYAGDLRARDYRICKSTLLLPGEKSKSLRYIQLCADCLPWKR